MTIQEANKLLESWEKKNPEPTIDEVLSELRSEYQKTVEVYGARAEKYPAHSRQYKTNLNDLLSRLAKLKKAGAIIRSALDIGEQTQLFNNG